MSKSLQRLGRIGLMLCFLLTLFNYPGQVLASPVTSTPKLPGGLGAPGVNSINFYGAAPGIFNLNSYVSVPYALALNPSGGAMTIEAWVRRNSTNACETVVGNNFSISYWLGFCTPTGHIRFYSHGAGSLNDSNGAVPANAWTHVAVTYDGATTKFYINGNLDTTTSANPGPITPATNGQELDIGADVPGGGYYFAGNVEELRIWNTVRNQAQIQGSMFQILGGPQPGLLAEWPFGGDAKDYAHAHNGTGVTELIFQNDGAIPHDIRVPQVTLGTPPVLNGTCDTQTKYANATQVTVGGSSVYLMHSDTDMWVCFSGLLTSTAPDNWAAVYLDVNHTRVDPSQTNHYSLEVHENNTLRARLGDGSGNYAATTTLDGQWSGIYANCCGEFPTRSAEFKISKGLLGGWSHVIGLALAQHWITGVGDDRLWPALASWNLPSTWSNTTLGGVGPARIYSGKVVYQPRSSLNQVGIPGVTINLNGSDASGGDAVADTATSSLDGSFSLTSTDDFPLHRLLLSSSSIPRGYDPSSAASQSPGVVIDMQTINFGSAPGGTYPNNIFLLGDPKPYVTDTANGAYFLIIASQQMINDSVFSDFVDFKLRIGFQVELASVESINTSYSGADIGDKIRNLEKARLASYGARFHYVMLVGPNSVIPHRFMQPYNEKKSDCVPGTGLPTDWTYADLTSNFDSNGNNCLADGIWGDPTKREAGYVPDSGIKFSPNVSVGRLPYTSEGAVKTALADILGFEQQAKGFKNSTILAASMMDFVGKCWTPAGNPGGSYTTANCDHVGTSPSDGSYLDEVMKSNFLNLDAYSSTYFYENQHPATGSSPAHIISPLPNDAGNMVAQENKQAAGMINLTGHGNQYGVFRLSWTDDSNHDGILEQPAGPPAYNNEWTGQDLMTTGELWGLTRQSANGAVFITASCSTGDYTDPNSFGATVLAQGNGVAWVGGLATVQYYGNWQTVNNGPYGGMEDLDYFVSQRLLDRNLRVGDAFWQAMKQYLANGNTDFSGIDYDMYGDPTMSYWGNPGQQSTLASWPMLRNNSTGQGYEALSGPGVPTQLWNYTATAAPGITSLAPSPVVSNDGEVVVAEGNHVDVLWNGGLFQQLNLDAAAYGTPAIAADGSIYVLDVNGKLYDFNYATLFFCFGGSCSGGIISPWRSRRWTYNLGSAPLTSPIIGPDGMIAVARLGGNFFGILYSNVDLIRPDGHSFREEPILGNAIGALAVSADQKLFAATTTGTMVKIDFYCPSGTCKNDDGYNPVYSTPPLLAYGDVYAGRSDGVVIEKNSSLALLHSFTADSAITAGPVEGPGGQILVGTQNGTLYSLSSNLTLRWSRATGAPVTSVPAYSNDAVYVANNNLLKAYDPYSGVLLWLRAMGTGTGAGSVAVGYGRELYIQTSGGPVQGWGEGWAHRPWFVSVWPGVFGQGVDAHPIMHVQFAYNPPLPPGVAAPQTPNQPNASTVTGFLLQRSSNGTDWIDIATIAPGANPTDILSYDDNTILPGITYAYRIQALDSGGNNSDFNTSASAQSDPALPFQPVLASAVGRGAHWIELTWSENPASVVSAFRVERSAHGANTFSAIAFTSGEATTFADLAGDLTPATTYDYRVVAMNATGQSSPSAILSGTTFDESLPAPANVKATLGTDGKVTISWTPGPADETAVLEVNPQGLISYNPLGIMGAAVGTFTYDPLAPNNFGYRMKFTKGTSDSAYIKADMRINTHGFVGLTKFLTYIPQVNK
ncbi:MAG TPA: LamG-like jellyroll fold domain-containing protein [Anaerolineaceae bacterium]|nr:LamG-like jellyroll fold domain-containing protein [Anaerolineaceae bacterium]